MRLERVLILENSAYLSIDQSRLSVDRRSEGVSKIALVDIAALVIESPQVVLTTAVLQSLAEHDIPLQVADSKHYPAAMLFPTKGHVATVERQRKQLDLNPAVGGGLWQKIIAAKIRNQAAVLKAIGQDTAIERLLRLATELSPGDPGNHEAQAAQAYWPALFENNFRREKRGAEEVRNSALNFGYTIVRALVARYVALSGLTPISGIGHTNQQNPLALVDDLMEPFRPAVDWLVVRSVAADSEWTTSTKQQMLQVLENPMKLGTNHFRFSAAVFEFVQNYVRAITAGDASRLICPAWLPPLNSESYDGEQTIKIK
jgi:CRISP-associated protein Cas1